MMSTTPDRADTNPRRTSTVPGVVADRAPRDFAELVDLHLDSIFRFLHSMVRDRELARDLTQETFLKLQRAGVVERGEAPPVSYLFATARNTALSHFRRRKREERHLEVLPPAGLETAGPAVTTNDPAAALDRTETREALRAALARLPENLRAVFLLSEIEGLSYAEIARTLECPAGTVASRKHEAVRRLRRELEGSGHAL